MREYETPRTKDIPHAAASPGTWQDGVEATASILYAAMFEGGEFPKPHEDYPALNKLVAALNPSTEAAPCCSPNSPTCTASESKPALASSL